VKKNISVQLLTFSAVQRKMWD